MPTLRRSHRCRREVLQSLWTGPQIDSRHVKNEERAVKTEDIEKSFHELKDRFRRRAISKEEFQEQVKGIFFRDQEGDYWTIGAQTEQWYRYDGAWVRDSAPATLEPAAAEVGPPGAQLEPPAPSRRRDYRNRIVMALVSLLFLVCLVAVAVVSYQLGRLSVTTTLADTTPTAILGLIVTPTGQAAVPGEAETPQASPSQPGETATASPAVTRQTASPARSPTSTSARQPTATPMRAVQIKYGPPVLELPEDGVERGPGYDAVLQWKSVTQDELPENEYYHVEVCWNGCDSRDDFWGDYVKGTMYVFPGFLRGRAIDEKYYWHVIVRTQVGDAPAGPSDPPISEPSETWVFLLPTR